MPGAVDYARAKIGRLGRVADGPVLAARVRLTERPAPTGKRPVIAQANLDVAGRLVRAQVEGATAREAIDRLEDRLRRRLERVARHWEARRGAMPTGQPHEWRHHSEPERRPAHFPRPAQDREVVRRKAFTLDACTLDEAAEEMELLDHDFHLFTEKATGYAAVLSRGGEAGYRLTLVAPRSREHLAPFRLPVAISDQQVPCLTTAQAVERLNLSGLPFLFFVEAAEGRACVLYHRYDGHYGLITPAG
ncbi:sigma 54 modulation/S30EA ribosomal C-terminal domain-containing protein [Mycobacterium sp. IS-1496]|uniref:sigma 54 modulation/S30EA ribosomal C-terminal domain-containing protein n=1 Tax=Mycobacterium sp. IS-1496 TaxID=1772284 RepID=UPI0025704A15|nr:sigma 54 modulation/S30EA ribosomal C-terminal domain-containing protein [Mycobacterium sp. IS-1496]